MRRSILAIATLLFAIVVVHDPVYSQFRTPETAADLFQSALELERGKGDLAGAMQLYQRIVSEFPAERPVVARALYRLGYGQELAGQGLARKYYDQVLRDYSDQTAVVAEARSRLAAMNTVDNAPRYPAVFVAVLDARTGMVSEPAFRLTPRSAETERYPTWSPDGRTIAFKRSGTAPALTVLRAVESGQEKTYPQSAAGPSPWLRDSEGVIARSGNLLLRDALDGRFRLLTNLGLSVQDVALSPDDRTAYALVLTRTVVFLSSTVLVFDVGSGERRRAFSLPAGGATTADLRSPAKYIAVSPDGNTLAVVRWTGDRQPNLGRWDIEGAPKGETAIGPGLIQCIQWTRDGRAVLFARSEFGTKWQIMRLPTDGSAPKFTGLEVTDLSYFDLSPDGSRITFDGTAYTIVP